MQPSDDAYRTLAALSSGTYSNYRIHCAFENPADAERTAAKLNGESQFPEYRTEALAVVPAGRLPRRVVYYRTGVTVYRHAEQGAEPILCDHEVWEWEAPLALRQLPMRGPLDGQVFEGTDKDLVVQAAAAYLAELRKAINQC